MKTINFANLTKEQIWQLRQQVVVGSLFLKDYENDFGFDKNFVCTFFDGYIEYLQECFGADYDFEKCDNINNLYDWYCDVASTM